MNKLAVFVEQICTEFQDKFTLPGETFLHLYEKLKAGEATPAEQIKVAYFLEQIEQLPDEGFCELIYTFDHHLVHKNFNQKNGIQASRSRDEQFKIK